MFDIGWSELLLIIMVALIFIGPKQLPLVAYKMGKFIGRCRDVVSGFQKTLEQAAFKIEADELNKKIMANYPTQAPTSTHNNNDDYHHSTTPESDDNKAQDNKTGNHLDSWLNTPPPMHTINTINAIDIDIKDGNTRENSPENSPRQYEKEAL